MSTAPDPSGTPPEQFGPYVIYERLGLGGMATVHRAKKHGIAGFERGVALKRMLSHLSEDAEFVQSFIREAKVASLLVHPNIAQVYDFGRIDGVYFIAMEHVEGHDVRRILRHANRSGQAIPLPVVLQILMELCDALEFAHNFRDEHGHPLNIVHRDVSPSNLIIATTGHLKVIDFGIAKASARSLHTESGRAKGKLGYMSPEVAMGTVMGPVSDVFSTGVVAHELLTAVPLFTAKTDFETMLRIREGEIDPPSRRNASCPPELDQIVLAALSRDPRTRLPTAGAFRHALDAVAHNYGIRPSARDVADYISRIGIETPRQRGGRETSNPYSAEFAALSSQSGSFGYAGTPSGSFTPPGGHANDDLDDWGDVPNPSSRLNIPELGPHFTPSQRSMSGQMAAQKLSVSHVFNSQPILPAQAQVATLPPGSVAQAKSRTGLVVTLVALIALVGAGIAYITVLQPKGESAPKVATATTATLKLVVMPADAKIEIGGKPVARDANDEVTLDPGVYSITITKDGYQSSTSSVELKAGEKTSANIALVKNDETNVVANVGSATPTPVEPGGTPTTDTSTNPKLSPKDSGRDKGGRRPPKDAPKGSNAVTVKDDPDPPDAGSGSAAVTPPKPPEVTPPKPPETPITPPKPPDKPKEPARTPMVGTNAVAKVSGEMPAIKTKTETSGQLSAKICIDTSGRVTDVTIKKLPPDVIAQLQTAIRGWRYRPYTDPTSKQVIPVCFLYQSKLVFKKSD